jgi:surface carbohydrate biosynthesis protein
MDSSATRRRVVILVDNKTRDLFGACLLGRYLEQLGFEVVYEPLEATFAVLAAHRPDVIVFNHLSASHLVRYSHRLRDLGVHVAVMMNEGIAYTQEQIDFLAIKTHKNAHVDVFLCWSKPFADSLHTHRPDINAPIVGIPRFDGYFEPFRSVYRRRMQTHPGKTELLVCTNYVLAKYHEMPPEEADKLLADWSKSIDALKEYHTTCAVSHRNRSKLFSYLEPLLADGRYHVNLRPHPNEDRGFYLGEIEKLPDALRENLTFRPDENIAELICACDLEISMDSCTTARDSWIAGKPTIELPMEPDPALTNRFEGLNVDCMSPDEIVRLVEENLQTVDPKAIALRKEHLDLWFGAPDGQASRRAAEAVLASVQSHPRPDWSRLTFSERRKGLKLKLLRLFGQPYGWNPVREMQRFIGDPTLQPYNIRKKKTVRPQDVAEMRSFIRQAFGD